ERPDDVKLYQFSAAPVLETPSPTIEADPDRPNKLAVSLGDITFPRAAAGDRLLTVEGQEVSYIAKSRWSAPSETLFQGALVTAFARQSAAVDLVNSASPRRSQYRVTLAVQDFAVHYKDKGRNPMVVVRMQADLVRIKDRAVVLNQTFEAMVPAKANRVSDIVAAYERAVQSVNADLIRAVDARVRAGTD
ncbi:MAG: ABC-type transport auxiliary lipoprotein family protein, partial [Asticcacaulis sp.]